ncbi:MAG: thioredoxin fold domain-containing protein [Algibacter sp.]
MNTSINRITCQLLTLMIAYTLFLSSITIQAQGINFESGNWEAVQEQAKTTNKLIFVHVYTNWCGPCKWMDKNIYNNKEVGDYFNAHFVSYKLGAEKGEGLAFSKKYAVNSYPDLLFIDATGKRVIRHSGALEVKKMLEFGKKALHSEKDARAMPSAYNEGNRAPEFMGKYLAFLKENDLPTTGIAISYLEAFDKKQWLSRENMLLIYNYVHSPYNKVIEYLTKQGLPANTYYKMGMGPIPVHVYNQYLEHIIKEKNTPEAISKLLKYAKSRLNSKDNIAYLNYRAKMLTAKREKDWDSYTQHIMTYVNTYCLNFPSALNNYAWVFYTNDAITDPKALNEALRWVNLSLQKDKDNWGHLDTKAAVLYKLGRKEDAFLAANKAIKLAEKEGSKASVTLKLIEKIKAL